ncbi:phage terminase large subunit [bacterium]|nr:phage terminase large subunit [bacterium]
MHLTDRQIEKLARTATPALFANYVTGGQYMMPRHIQLVDEKITDLATGRIRRLIIQMPPRHGKSELVSKYFPAWYLGNFPNNRFGVVSYEAEFASTWGHKARELIREHGADVFGVTVSGQSKARDSWNIAGHTGGMNTAGIGGPLTGKGFHVLQIDDPVKNAEEALSPTIRDKHWDWFNSTALTRIEPGGGVCVMMTRWHDDDLIGRILQRARESGEHWEVVSLPALAEENDPLGREVGEPLWPARYPREVLEQQRRNLDVAWWMALYQQRPGQHGRTEWPSDYFGDSIWMPPIPNVSLLRSRVVTLDPSKGKDGKAGDYSAITGIGINLGRINVRTDIKRRPTSQMIADLLDFYIEFGGEAVGIESNQFQELLGAELQRQADERGLPPLPLYLIENKVNKQIRIRRLGPYLCRGEMIFEKSPSNELLISQLREFPLGRHDDGPDSLEMGIRLALEINGIAVADDGLGHNLLEQMQ